MPFGKWASFDACVTDMMRPESEGGQGYDEETAKKTCGKLQAELGKESFSWAGDLKVFGKNLIRGQALHPLKTVHPQEWPSVRVYLEEELEKAAHTLSDTALLLDHMAELPTPNRVLAAQYEDGSVEYIAQVSDDVLQKIHDGLIKHCSVEFDWKTLEKMRDGEIAPRGITFTGLSLLEQFEPGDPLTTVEVWEALVQKIKEAKMREQGEPEEFIYYAVRDPHAFLQEHFSTAWIDKINGIQAIRARLREKPESVQPVALLFMKANGWTLETMQQWLQDHPQYPQYWKGPETAPPAVGVQSAQFAAPPTQVIKMNVDEFKEKLKAYPSGAQAKYLSLLEAKKTVEELAPLLEAEWDTEYINNLPDKCFAYIDPGGEKDEEGKTTPRDLRHLPIRNAQGNLDADHVRAALAALKGARTGEPPPYASKAKPKVCAAAKELEIESEVCDTHPEDQGGGEEGTKTLKERVAILEAKLKEQEGGGDGEPSGLGQDGEPRKGEPKTDKERLIEHYGEEVAQKLLDLIGEDAYKLLPPRGAGQEQAADMTVEKIKQRMEDLTAQKVQIEQQLQALTEEQEPERTALYGQIDLIAAELSALEQAMAAKIAAGAPPPEIPAAPPETLSGEGVVDPNARPPQPPEDMIAKRDVLALLPERVPMRWGYGPHQMVRKLEALCGGKGAFKAPMPFLGKSLPRPQRRSPKAKGR